MDGVGDDTITNNPRKPDHHSRGICRHGLRHKFRQDRWQKGSRSSTVTAIAADVKPFHRRGADIESEEIAHDNDSGRDARPRKIMLGR